MARRPCSSWFGSSSWSRIPARCCSNSATPAPSLTCDAEGAGSRIASLASMSDNPPDDGTTRDTDFAALWSSDGVTRSLSPTTAGLPADLPYLFAPGQRFGGYTIVRPIGKGGMGQVYEAE